MPTVLAAFAALLCLAAAALAQDRTLNVYNWSDYVDTKMLERFTAETGIKVNYDVYDSLETLEAKLSAGHSGYDIVVPTSEPTFARLVKSGALRVIDRKDVPDWSGLDPALMQRVEASDPGNQHGAIYMWGTIGLGILPDKVRALAPDAPEDSWELLLKPENARRLASCGISMLDSAIDVVPSVLKYLHKDPESATAADLAEVEGTLMAIRPFIRTFATAGAVEALASGDTCLALSYSGDVVQAAARAKEAGKPAVRYVAPKEFAQLWFDMLAIPTDAPHPAEAERFIAFMLQPDVEAANTDATRYPNAVPASYPMVEEAVRADPNVFPPQSAFARFFTVGAPTQAADRARTRMWARFKAGH